MDHKNNHLDPRCDNGPDHRTQNWPERLRETGLITINYKVDRVNLHLIIQTGLAYCFLNVDQDD